MATLDQTKVNVAVSNNSKLDLSSTHITSQNFMRLQPVYYRHMLPKEHLRGSGNALTRLAPVAVPTYGRCRLNLRSFFVPFRTIFPNWNEFITDTIGSNASNNSLIANSPYMYNYDLYQLFKDGIVDSVPLMSALDPSVPDDAAAIAAGAYDVILGTPSTYYVLSPVGRHFMKILNSLGYRVIWDAKDTIMPISALALLAYAKVYADWYANQAYLDSAEYLQIQRLFKFNDPTSALHLNYLDIANILGFCSIVCYDTGNDVFTNAWDNPVAPNSGLYSSFRGNDITQSVPGVNWVELDPKGSPVMFTQNAVNIGSEYIHQFLKSATDYVKRNQLSGAAQIDRFLTRFGVNLDSAKSNRSIYVSSKSIDVEFGTVMQTANTSSSDVSNLGDYAGQGLGRGQFSFDFQTDEFGIFIVTSSIVPAGSLFQGMDRNNFHLDKLSFYTPEFDNLGCSAISKSEVYVSNNSAFGNELNMQGVFGYAPRYYEYKQKLDYVTGDLVSPAAMQGGDSWHLNRIFDDSSFGGSFSGIVHSLDFTRGSDAGQYDRIFNYDNSDLDKFYVVYHFDVIGLAPCKSLFDTYDFDSAGQSLSINGNSAKVN